MGDEVNTSSFHHYFQDHLNLPFLKIGYINSMQNDIDKMMFIQYTIIYTITLTLDDRKFITYVPNYIEVL